MHRCRERPRREGAGALPAGTVLVHVGRDPRGEREDRLGNLHPRELTPFASSVYERACWAAARAILGRDPKHKASTVTIITQWNDTTAVCGETVAQRLRDGAAIIRLRIENEQAGIAEATL